MCGEEEENNAELPKENNIDDENYDVDNLLELSSEDETETPSNNNAS